MMNVYVLSTLIGFGIIFLFMMFYSFALIPFWLRYVWIRVAMGGLVLVKIRSKTGDYWKFAKVSRLVLKLKKRHEKHKTELTVPKDRPIFYRMLGVFVCDLDEDSNQFLTSDFKSVEGFDVETYENLIIRALMNPNEMMKWKVVVIFLCVIVLGLIIVGYMVRQGNQGLSKEHLMYYNQTVNMMIDFCKNRVI